MYIIIFNMIYQSQYDIPIQNWIVFVMVELHYTLCYTANKAGETLVFWKVALLYKKP